MHLEPENILVIACSCPSSRCCSPGFPVAWVLAGVGIAFAGIGYWTDK